MPIVKSVEKIEINIATTVFSNTGTLTKGQIDNKCVPFTTVATPRNGEERFDTRFVRVTIVGNIVTATRDQASNQTFVDVIIYVVEFTDECTITTGEVTIVSGQLTITDTVALTDLTKSFVYMTYTPTNATDDFNDALTTAEITDLTTLTFTRQATGSAVVCRWYTVECDATQFDVQRGVFSITGTLTTAQSLAFTSVVEARTMVIGNYNTTEGTDDAVTGNCTIDLIDSTHVRARRSNGTPAGTPDTIDIDFQVIQFAADQNISVQRGEFSVTALEDTDTITAVNIDGSMAHSPAGQNNANVNSNNGDDIGQIFCKMDVLDSTTVRGRVITNAVDTINSWEVIEWIVIPSEPIVRSVEQILITIPINQFSATGTLTKGQIDNKCVPFTTVAMPQFNDTRWDTRFAKVSISGSTVTATRDNDSPDFALDVIIFVVEYTDACTVQTGEATIASGTLSVTDSPPTNFTDLTKTFVYMTYIPSTALDDPARAFTTVEITNVSTLTFTRQNDPATTVLCRWYTVECDATQFDVQRGLFSLTGTISSTTSPAFTPVDMARTMVIGNYNTDAVDGEPETASCTIDLFTTTTVRAKRANSTTPASGEIDIDFQVIQFAADQNISVQRGEFAIPGGGTSDTDTITAVDLNRSMAHSPGGENNASINSSDIVNDISQIFAKIDLQDSTTVRGRVITAVIATVNSWEVIEYELSALEEQVFSTAITNQSVMI